MNNCFRFDRSRKLLDAASFNLVFKKAHYSHDKFFTVLSHNKKEEKPKLGMAISKKNCRYATNRNRIKRVIREIFRQNQTSLLGLDIVVVNKPGSTHAKNRELTQSLEKHFRKCISKKQINNNQEN